MAHTQTDRQLRLVFDPRTLRHLGSQMYGGGLVKPLAELVANAWDADATRVEISLPTQDSPVARVTDDGHGMTWDECQDLYLTIGVNRRTMLKSDLTRSGTRKVMGRKGLGKLAVTQVSRVIEVETVARTESGEDEPVYWLTHFKIPFGEYIDAKPGEPGPDIEMVYDGPAPDGIVFTNGSRTGTRTTLHGVQLARMPNVEQFVESMHLRFALSAEDEHAFRIVVDGQEVPTVEEAIAAEDYEFTFGGVDDVGGLGKVTWWLGFTPEPQKRDERLGIGVFARGRLAVDRPFYFNLTQGFTGQLSKEYMTGSVKAEAIDDREDLIATDRGSIDWSHPLGEELEKWGQDLIRTHARIWEQKRGKRRLEDLKPDPKLQEMIGNLSRKPRSEAETLLRRLANLPHVGQGDIDRTARVLLNGLQHQEFADALSEMNAANVEQLPEVLDQWSVLEALLFLPVVKSRIDVIDKLEELIETAAPEFPDIFNHLKENPELLRPEWQPLTWNQWMSTIVTKVFEAANKDPSQIRPDVLCLSDSHRFVIVELKRPGKKVSVSEANTFLQYMRRINEEVERNDDWRGSKVEGLMVCDELDPDASFMLDERGDVGVKSWRGFLEDAQRSHRYILDRVALRVPTGDPRAAPYLPNSSGLASE